MKRASVRGLDPRHWHGTARYGVHRNRGREQARMHRRARRCTDLESDEDDAPISAPVNRTNSADTAQHRHHPRDDGQRGARRRQGFGRWRHGIFDQQHFRRNERGAIHGGSSFTASMQERGQRAAALPTTRFVHAMEPVEQKRQLPSPDPVLVGKKSILAALDSAPRPIVRSNIGLRLAIPLMRCSYTTDSL
jgi:hypothetical protein